MKKYILLLVLPLLAFGMAHKFYLSVTNINYSEKDDAFQITTRIFIDDLEAVLKERYGVSTQLDTQAEAASTDEYVQKYLRAKFLVYLDGAQVQFNFIGKEYEDDVVLCYMELPKVNLANLTKMEVENEILTDLYEEQKNVVHVKWNGNKRSFILIKSNAKGMLKL